MNIDPTRHCAAMTPPLIEPAPPRQGAPAPAAAAEQPGTRPPSPRYARGANSTVERSLRTQAGAQSAPAAALPAARPAPTQRSVAPEVLAVVDSVLPGMRYRVGGSLAARIRHNAPRDPKDIDLEFVNFTDANRAAERLSEFRGAEAGPFPHVLYFVEGEREDDISITMAAMGIRHPGETRSQLTQIELNNENTRQGNRDFKHLPASRYGNEQPAYMRRNSLVAGVLERFSYTLAEGKSDDKEDGAQLRSLLSGMDNEELARLTPEIRDHFNWDAIRSAPPETVQDSSSGEEDVSAASGSESDSESSSIASIGAGHAFAPARPRSVSDSSSEEDDVSVASGSASDSESSSAASGGAWHALASAPPHSVDDSSSEEDDVSVASRSDSDNESASTTSSAAPATPLVINHEARMTGAMEYLGRLVAQEQTQRAAAR